TTAQPPATPPSPVPLSAPACTACIFPHLSLPKRGPQGTRGSSRGLHRILWGLDTGMHGQGLPVPTDPNGTPALHDATRDTVLRPWADDGSLWPALGARGRQLAVAPPRQRRGLPGDGPNTGAQQGARAGACRGTNPSRARRFWPSSPRLAMSAPP